MPKGIPLQIDFNKIYHSKFDGDYIILEEIERDKYNNRQVIIKWFNSGTTQIVNLSNAVKCSIRDKSIREIDVNKIYNSNFGQYKIIESLDSINGHKMVNILFIKTGTLIAVRLSDALNGNVRDRYYPNVAGVGCIGNASSYHPAYSIWEGMIQRCYNKNLDIYKRYGDKGVTVCDKWLCFEYFLLDLPYIDGYNDWVNNPSEYNIDKDSKQICMDYNDKIYSLNTCCFIHVSDNINISRYEGNIRNDSECKYVGVRKITNNSYKAVIEKNGKYENLGVYKTPELAAAAYNNEIYKYNNNPKFINDVPYIKPEDLQLLNKNL